MSATPSLMIAGSASGQGKTSVTAALARFHTQRGLRVRVFKTGPDFLDPMILERASGAPVYNLDLWMTGEADCRARLSSAAADADLLLVESMMGLYDGQPSSADLALHFNLPVAVVMDASAMAQTFGALAQGLAAHRPGLRCAGMIANRIGGAGHAQMLRQSLPTQLPLLAGLPHDTSISLPERHLGLVQAQELPQLDALLDRWADLWVDNAATELPPVVDFPDAVPTTIAPLLRGRRIAVARDAAFAFLYAANLDTLRTLGAELLFFSPLADNTLPDCDALWLPGGYPELHLRTLSQNAAMKQSLHAHHTAGKPILAECGGLLWLLDALTDAEGHHAPMLGLLRGHAIVGKHMAALGLQECALPEGTLRGHSFHFSKLDTPMAPLLRASSPHGGGVREAVYRHGCITASYVHFYFPSNPQAVAGLFGA